jgi:hypothetical protein
VGNILLFNGITFKECTPKTKRRAFLPFCLFLPFSFMGKAIGEVLFGNIASQTNEVTHRLAINESTQKLKRRAFLPFCLSQLLEIAFLPLGFSGESIGGIPLGKRAS